MFSGLLLLKNFCELKVSKRSLKIFEMYMPAVYVYEYDGREGTSEFPSFRVSKIPRFQDSELPSIKIDHFNSLIVYELVLEL
jgi:hypothetical protein